MRGRIMKGELKPGQRLTEEWLAAELGVSRIPVRETIRALASEGFVRSEHYGRTFVATLDAQAGHDLLDVRAVLEPLAGREHRRDVRVSRLAARRRRTVRGRRAGWCRRHGYKRSDGVLLRRQ